MALDMHIVTTRYDLQFVMCEIRVYDLPRTHPQPLRILLSYISFSQWLIIGSTGKPSVFKQNLNDIPFPPGGTGGVTGEVLAFLNGPFCFIVFYRED